MPAPKKGESEQAFVSRYMGSKEAAKTFPKAKQRTAVAYSEYAAAKKKRRKPGRSTTILAGD